MSVTKQAVIEKLKTVNGPDFSGNIVDLGLVSEIFIADSKVFFSITVPAARANDLEPLRAAAERAVKSMPGEGYSRRRRRGGGAHRREERRRHGGRTTAGSAKASHIRTRGTKGPRFPNQWQTRRAWH